MTSKKTPKNKNQNKEKKRGKEFCISSALVWSKSYLAIETDFQDDNFNKYDLTGATNNHRTVGGYMSII